MENWIKKCMEEGDYGLFQAIIPLFISMYQWIPQFQSVKSSYKSNNQTCFMTPCASLWEESDFIRSKAQSHEDLRKYRNSVHPPSHTQNLHGNCNCEGTEWLQRFTATNSKADIAKDLHFVNIMTTGAWTHTCTLQVIYLIKKGEKTKTKYM
jgi:hypothetical protein